MSIAIEDKYKKLSHIEHIRLRPSTYVGNTKFHNELLYMPLDKDDYKMTLTSVNFVPAFIKLFDEIISNSVDFSKRDEGKNLTTIKVNIDEKTGEISVWDNGGIPVVIHKEYNQYVPEIIFSELMSGENYNDDEERTGAGTNGLGSKLTNIFSNKFVVKTCDGKNRFIQTCNDGLTKKSEPKITASKTNFTEISYIPDYEYFDIKSGDEFGLDEIHYDLMFKRVLDIAGCNSNLKVYFNGKQIKIKNFQEYSSYFCDNITFDKLDIPGWDIGVGYSSDGFQHSSFVNSVSTYKGGTHVEYISSQIVAEIRTFVEKKYKTKIKPSDVKNHLFVFVNAVVVNSSFDSQTKESLVTEAKTFNGKGDVFKFIPTKPFITKVNKSEIIGSITDWLDKAKVANDNKELRKLNKALDGKKVQGLIDATEKKNRAVCSLGIFEGLSALSAVRKFRNAKYFGAFPLRGKFINVSEMTPANIIKNEEAQKLMATIGLKMGEKATNLRYGKIRLYTDADVDGDAISSLVGNFLYKFWPELFDGIVEKVYTPYAVAKKAKKTQYFYNETDYLEFVNSTKSKGWNLDFKKGLAALEDEDYNEIINNPYAEPLIADDETSEFFDVWFGKDTSKRKYRLQGEAYDKN